MFKYQCSTRVFCKNCLVSKFLTLLLVNKIPYYWMDFVFVKATFGQRYRKRLFRFPNFGRFRDVSGRLILETETEPVTKSRFHYLCIWVELKKLVTSIITLLCNHLKSLFKNYLFLNVTIGNWMNWTKSFKIKLLCGFTPKNLKLWLLPCLTVLNIGH